MIEEEIQDQIIETFQFQDKEQQQLFQILTSRIKLPSKPYTEADLKVDLVIKIQIPSHNYTFKSNQTPFDFIFKNNSPLYEEMYNLVQEYITYLVQNTNECKDSVNPLIRKMTTLKQTYQQNKQRRLLLKDDTQRFIDIECSHQFQSKIDTFTLQYNMIMLTLQKICGFQVKSFLIPQQDKQQNQQTKLYLYILLSLNTPNLMKIADKYKIKKEVSMVNLDFSINQPVDSAGRPLRTNSFFKENPQTQGFCQSVKQINRQLGLSNKAFSEQILDQVYITQQEINKCERYYDQLLNYVNSIRSIPQKEGEKQKQEQLMTSLYQIHESDQILKTKGHWLLKKYQKKEGLTIQEREYLYIHNRKKINKGCQEYMIKLKKKKQVFHKIIQLNKKYGYEFINYEDTFVQFMLPSKKKNFFDKLAHILNYQNYKNTPFQEISLFTPMQRIKLAYLKLSQAFKIQNFSKKGITLYTVNNQYQKFADPHLEFNEYLQQDEQKIVLQKAVEQQKQKCLQKQWHPFIPFKTNIRTVRDYMGDNFAFQLAFKIHIISYLFIMCIPSLGLQIGLQYLYSDRSNNKKQYIFSIAQLLVLFFSYVLLIQLWKKKQSKYLNNYVQKNQIEAIRSTYKGPYVRNLINDNPNTFETQKNGEFIFRQNVALIALFVILAIEGLCFWGIRKLIRDNYGKFPTIYLISTGHLAFYCLFYAGNYFLYALIFRRLFQKVVQYVNYAKNDQHNATHRKLINLYNFGFQLIGPLYLMIIEEFNGSSCYARNCLDEFQNYIISRYLITLGIVLLKNLIFLFRVSRMYFKKKEMKKYTHQNQIISHMFEFKLNQLLKHIEFQSQKIEVEVTVIEEMIVFFFYSIFYMRFPFGEVFSLAALTMNYSIKRFEVLYLNRRPIPSNTQLYKFSEVIERLYIISILVNCWAIFFNYRYMEYELLNLITIFINTVNLQNILTFKLLAMVMLLVFFLVATQIFRKIASLFGEDSTFQKRKMNKFKEFLINAKGKPQSKLKLQNSQILKTILRTYTLQFVIEYKKNKFNFLKQKLRAPAPADLSLRQKSINKKTQKQFNKSTMQITHSMVNTQTVLNHREGM